MDREHNPLSDIEDIGCKESEDILRSTMEKKYLDNAAAQADKDYDEIVELLEREKNMADASASGYVDSLDLASHKKALDKHLTQNKSPRSAPTSNYSTRDRAVSNTLAASDQLLKVSSKASSTISATSGNASGTSSPSQARKEDQKYVKDVLAAGKRVVGKESGASGSGGEASAQAEQIFGGGEASSVDSAKALKCAQKGVRKMAKGLPEGA